MIFISFLSIIRDYFAHHIIFSAGLLLIVGYIFGNLVEKIKLPAITGYILAGVVIGSSGLKLIHEGNMEILFILSEITLSFIAVLIGGEFSFYKLKIYGKKILFLTMTQMLLTFILVSFGLILIGFQQYIAFILGAISAATAPAATVVIVEKLKARGKFVDYLYGVVALDDAGTIILFSIVFAISGSAIGEIELNINSAIFHALKEIFYSILIGIIGGLAIHFSTIKKRNLNEIKIISFGLIFLATSVAISLHLSPLISNMVLGMLLINMNKKNIRIMFSFEPITPPLYAIFFAIAGAELHLAIFQDKTILIAGLVYILMRFIGKYFGILASGISIKMEKNIRNYLGLALLPQAGVAIGLLLFVKASPIIANASPEIQSEINQMTNIVLMSVFINEIVGPPLAKLAILKNLKRRK
ncbi:MAG: hypothetical protein HN952_06335 [Candidatus Cloacimonetes bacterium]|jgi:Kef-type K+ transport system membrane component KefB|nr:hypothetical protein [Candidatus Cloacimonadota bacterium]MBT6994557.1 hypothetical protein [Candidatus Cloacimonadota bacterium]